MLDTVMEKMKAILQSEHVEVTLRMGVTMMLGYVLAFANVSVIPIETNILLGILVPFCTMLFPTLMFTFGSIIFPLLSVFLLIFLSTTLLLTIAVIGGTGAYIAAFAIWCFWITFFRFDKTEGNKCSLVLIAIVFQTVLIWPNYETVQSGIVVPNEAVQPNVEKALMALVEGAVEAAKELGVGTHMIDIDSGTLAGRTAAVTINADGSNQTFIEGGMWIVRGMWTFSGTQNPLATYSNFTIFTCWLILILSVAVLTPPFRTMRSAVWRGIIPSAMKDAAKSIRLHAARMEVHLKQKSTHDIENDNDGNSDNKKGEENSLDISEGARLATRGRCVYHINALFGGTLAKYTAFEPRLLVLKPIRCTTGILMALSNAVSRCVRIAVGIELLTQMDDEKEFLYHNIDQYLEVAAILEICAKAMAIGDAKILSEIEDMKEAKAASLTSPNADNGSQEVSAIDDNCLGNETEEPLEPKDNDNEPLFARGDGEQPVSNTKSSIVSRTVMKGDYKIVASDDENDKLIAPAVLSIKYDPFHLDKYTGDVVNLTRSWLEAMNPSPGEKMKFCSKISLSMLWINLKPWFMVQFSHFMFMVQLVKNLFDASSWKSILYPSHNNAPSRVIWCVKYTIGMTVLLTMSVYWTGYKYEFVLAPKDDPRRAIYAFQNGGWAIVAYCFATTQTTEGSVKKGILRMIGTVIGAFSGWLALVVCGDSSFQYSYNTYGVVAWLSITSFVATYISTERGFAARISLSNDYAYGPIYFVLTQIIIVSYGYYYYPTPEGRDIITINRMVANLVGIGLAVILAVIPPGLWGGDPVHCRSMVRYHWDTIVGVLRLLLSCPLIPDNGEPVQDFCKEAVSELDQLVEKIQAQSSRMQELAVDFEKDAARLQKMPRFQIDPKLKVEIAKVTRDIHITAFLPLLASNILKDTKKSAILLGRESYGRKELEALLAEMERGIGGGIHGEDARTKQQSSIVPSSLLNGLSEDETDVELLLRTIRWLRDEIYKHEELLDCINWGF